MVMATANCGVCTSTISRVSYLTPSEIKVALVRRQPHGAQHPAPRTPAQAHRPTVGRCLARRLWSQSTSMPSASLSWRLLHTPTTTANPLASFALRPATSIHRWSLHTATSQDKSSTVWHVCRHITPAPPPPLLGAGQCFIFHYRREEPSPQPAPVPTAGNNRHTPSAFMPHPPHPLDVDSEEVGSPDHLAICTPFRLGSRLRFFRFRSQLRF